MKLKFYLFGDSICVGQLVSHHRTWISSMSARLTAILRPGKDILIQNASINGNTTRLALERMSYDVSSHRPDVLLVQFGMNDCNFWQTDFGSPRVSMRAFEANLIEIVERAEQVGVKHIFLATNHPSLKGEMFDLDGFTHAESNQQYNAVIRRLSGALVERTATVTLIDNERCWLELIASNPEICLRELLLPDGIHLSERGHSVYDQFAGSIICKYFQEKFT